MKKIIIIILLIAVGSVGASFQVGRVIESELPAVLDRIGDLSQMQIEVTSYERNLFRSSVTSQITLASISGNEEQISLKHQIWHGPFPFGKSRNGELHVKPMSALAITTVDQNNPPTGLIGKAFEACPELFDSIEITHFDFAGNGISHFKIPGFEKYFGEGDEAVTFTWQGMSGTANIDKSLKSLKGEVTIPMLRLADPSSRMETGTIHSTYRISEDFGGLLLGNVTLTAATIDIIDNQQKTALKDFQFRNAAKLKDDLVSYSIAIGIETLEADNQSYGPAGFELDFVNLDATTILKVQKRLQTIQSQIKVLSEDEIASQVFEIYAEALPALIKRKPEIKLNFLNLQSPLGDFWTKGNILFENPAGEPVIDLNSFLGTVNITSDTQVSKPLLQKLLTTMVKSQMNNARTAGQLGDINDNQLAAKADAAVVEQLAKLQADGAIIDEGKNFRMEFTYKNRQPSLNAKTLTSKE